MGRPWEAVREGTGSNGQWTWQENGAQTTQSGASAPTRNAIWVAPTDVTENTTFTLQCTLDDAAGAIAAGEAGDRDDEEVVRQVTVNVTPYGVQFGGGQLVRNNTLLRACAGGVDDHNAQDPDPARGSHFQFRAHTRQVDITVTLNAQPLLNAPVTLQFEGNQGHNYGAGIALKTAKLHNVTDPVDASHPWSETLSVTTDGQGKASFWVLSSDVICQPKLQVMRQPAPGQRARKIGEIECDFAAPTSLRRFPNQFDPQEVFPREDTGWLFDYPVIASRPNGETPAKIYAKFMKDETLGNQEGNWQFVNDHQLRFYIDSVELGEGAEPFTGRTEDYAVVVDPSNSTATTRTMTTGIEVNARGERDGAAQVVVRAMQQAKEAQFIRAGVEDLTIHAE